MKINFIETKNKCSVAIIDNFYNETELKQIKEELLSLFEVSKLQIYNNGGVSRDEKTNEKLQKSDSLFLDELFVSDRSRSKILTANRKLFLDKKLKEKLTEQNLFYNLIYESNRDSTLVNFYKKNDFYKTHKDNTCFTVLTFFELTPFVGGNLVFPEFKIKIEPLENRTVIFPGFLLHTAEEVKSGVRVSMAQFINMI